MITLSKADFLTGFILQIVTDGKSISVEYTIFTSTVDSLFIKVLIMSHRCTHIPAATSSISTAIIVRFIGPAILYVNINERLIGPAIVYVNIN